ncbi:MAG: SAM-dependent methyltransferase [Ruminococcaceae bacterium]|nr:SAM-dependent methyltransferase [Oscillospiraceae bacterium]
MAEKNITLDGRLSCAASFVREGSVVADIGTDHAYIPIYLITHGISKFAIASDINKGPLQRAVKNAEEYGVGDKMCFTLADGLDGIGLEEHGVGDIVICGMGGELISQIIDASEYTRRSGIRLILQPMSCAAELREYLASNGFNIIKEKLCTAAGKIYTCILAEYDGVVREFNEIELMLGSHNIDAKEELFNRFASSFARKLEVKIAGLERGGHDSEKEREILADLKKIIENQGEKQ